MREDVMREEDGVSRLMLHASPLTHYAPDSHSTPSCSLKKLRLTKYESVGSLLPIDQR